MPTNDRIVVIGENMPRVRAFAEEYGYGYNDVPELPPEMRLAANRAWINARMDGGYTIVDIGPAPSCANYPYATSPYYAAELADIAGRGYTGWLPIWGVFD